VLAGETEREYVKTARRKASSINQKYIIKKGEGVGEKERTSFSYPSENRKVQSDENNLK
jgi:hypothetical protein